MKTKFLSIFLLIIFLTLSFSIISVADNNINLIVDGEDITNLSEPIIKNDRTLVPIRFVSEALGAKVIWNNDERTVYVNKNEKSLLLKIGSRLVNYNDGEFYQLSDVEPIIINDRTFVPLRLISNALGVGINWEPNTRTVMIDSGEISTIEPFYEVEISSHKSGDIIRGKTDVEISMPTYLEEKAEKIDLLLFNKSSFEGYIVGSINNLNSKISFLPKVENNGQKVLIAAVYNSDNEFIGGKAISINIDIKPEVNIKGLNDFEEISKSVEITQDLNFLPKYINYEFRSIDNQESEIITQRDPFGSYTWKPDFENNGRYLVKVLAYDGNGNAYSSDSVPINVDIKRELSLGGITDGMVIDEPVNLIANRNFDVSETQYLISDSDSEIKKILTTIPYGGYSWIPKPENTGKRNLFVRVKDTKGNYHTSEPVSVIIDGRPKLFLNGIGPNQLLNDEENISVNSNVELDNIELTLFNNSSGSQKVIVENLKTTEEFSFKPSLFSSGSFSIQAKANYNGESIYSEKIPFKIYLDKLYGPKPIIEKDKFLEFSSKLAIESYNKTKMSAALQTAQAILETGWGQSLPVDKYNGKFSNNLFGIKGKGTNGSVISNTWEVYNGNVYRVDAAFRSYNNVEESWQDHKRILLNLSRYEQFRNVMYDYTLGAWAIRRAGYATDPKYPIKLMRIIEQYDLDELDKVGI